MNGAALFQVHLLGHVGTVFAPGIDVVPFGLVIGTYGQQRPTQHQHFRTGHGGDAQSAFVQLDPARPDTGSTEIRADSQIVVNDHAAFGAGDLADQTRTMIARGKEVDHPRFARGGLPVRFQHEGPVLIVPSADLSVTDAHTPPAVVGITEDRGKDCGRIEVGEAQPVDAAFTRDQSGRVEVGQQGVLLEWNGGGSVRMLRARCHVCSISPGESARSDLMGSLLGMETSQNMTSTDGDQQPTTMIIVGANGDLAHRLVLPALGEVLTRQPDKRLKIIGTARRPDPEWQSTVKSVFDSVSAHGPAVEHAVSTTQYVTGDVSETEDLAAVLKHAEGRSILYFALPPSATIMAMAALEHLELPQDLWIALEKPIGTDQPSARELNAAAQEIVAQERIFRVDHFLGMPATLDLVGLRLANRILEPLLNREHVERIEIVFEETLGLEGRAAFYDSTGAIRDMLQSHLLQTMGVLMMEPPAALDDDEIPTLIAHVLRNTRLHGQPALSVMAGRYTAGSVGGKTLPDYIAEDGVDPDRKTETLGQITVEVDTWRWSGVPVTLRSGKAIGNPRQEIAVHFKPTAHRYPTFGGYAANVLRLSFEDAEITLEINAGGPYDARGLSRLNLSSSTGPQPLTAYGNVMSWLLAGNRAFSVHGEAAEQGWRIVQQAVDAISSGEVPLQDYPAGSSGPA